MAVPVFTMGEWGKRSKILISNMTLLQMHEGTYTLSYSKKPSDDREQVVGSLNEILDAIKVMVVTARIES